MLDTAAKHWAVFLFAPFSKVEERTHQGLTVTQRREVLRIGEASTQVVTVKQAAYPPRLALVAAENENNKKHTDHKTGHKYPASHPSPEGGQLCT